jgi:propanediol dehydratase small subunit
VAADPLSDYPLGQKRPQDVTTPAGVRLDDVTLDALRADRLRWEDLRATPETLRRQAAVAAAVGRTTLAGNLERAAELAEIPPDTILEIYSALRPHRSTAKELEAWAKTLDDGEAPQTAEFVREAIEVYARRGLLAGDRDRV